MEKKIRTPGELRALRDRMQSEMGVREDKPELRVTVHMGTCGIAAGARDVLGQLAEEVSQAGDVPVRIRQAGCAGLCDREPMMTVTDRDGKEYRYGQLNAGRVREIVREHLVGGQPIETYLIGV